MLNIQENFPMRTQISFRAGGNARFFAEVNTVEEIVQAKEFAQKQNLPLFLLGNGTNVLVSDNGYNGLVVKFGKALSEISFEESAEYLRMHVGASAVLGVVARKAAGLGFGGIHLLAGVPGTIGGAVYMNAGAYGQEIANCIESVDVLTRECITLTRNKEECEFSYRSSAFQTGKKFCDELIFGCTLKLPKGENSDVLKSEIDEAMQKRRASQPLDKPNAGSAFKRPATGFPGALIEQAGLKGYRIGDAQVSEKHANFIVNLGNATATDIEALFEYVQKEVYAKTGVQLEREVIILK